METFVHGPKSMIMFVLAVVAGAAGCAKSETEVSSNIATAAQRHKAEAVDVRDIAGIELGKDLVVPECKKEKAYGMILYAMDGVEYPCFEESGGAGGTLETAKDLPRGPDHNGVQSIELGTAAVPSGVEPTASVLMIDGTPEKVTLKTEGTAVQERLYGLLTSKYGAPTQSNVSQLQNAMGARYQGIEASWQLPGMSVLFLGVANRPGEGLIVATTPKGEQFFQDRQPKSASGF